MSARKTTKANPKVRAFASEAEAERWYERRAQGLDEPEDDDPGEELIVARGARVTYADDERTEKARRAFDALEVSPGAAGAVQPAAMRAIIKVAVSTTVKALAPRATRARVDELVETAITEATRQFETPKPRRVAGRR